MTQRQRMTARNSNVVGKILAFGNLIGAVAIVGYIVTL